MSLVIHKLHVGYGHTDILANTNASARPGRITAVIGPNAAGKTTMLRCICGLLKPRSGAVMLDDTSVHGMSAGQLARRIAYMPQRPHVSGGLSVRAVVELGRFALPRDDQVVTDALERLDLSSIAWQAFETLSVGQQQRVALARGLAQLADDGVLVLDEPTAAVDLAHTRDFLMLMRRAAQRGATVLCAMHDLSVAASIADDVWLLRDRTVECGPAQQVLVPESLQAVFGVPFRWVTLAEQSQVLFADVHTGPYTYTS